MSKQETVSIGDYKVSTDGKTKYIKLQASPKADDKTKKLVADLVALLGADVLYVNLFDSEFRAKHNIPDFAKGRISAPVNASVSAPVKAKAKDAGEDMF